MEGTGFLQAVHQVVRSGLSRAFLHMAFPAVLDLPSFS